MSDDPLRDRLPVGDVRTWYDTVLGDECSDDESSFVEVLCYLAGRLPDWTFARAAIAEGQLTALCDAFDSDDGNDS